VNDRQLLHGAAIAELIDEMGPVTVRRIEQVHDYAYELQRTTDNPRAVLFKYSTAVRTPWRFGFSPSEETAIEALISTYGEAATFVTFICGKDGVCCVPVDDLRFVMGATTLAGMTLAVARPRDSGYRLRGPGKMLLRNVIPKSAWPRSLWKKDRTTDSTSQLQGETQ
jgi:hypothetical protein